jgi:uroporphyrinogen decarboxylase
MNSKKLVYDTLSMENKSDRAPRHLWYLPWAEIHHKEYFEKIKRDFPDDVAWAPARFFENDNISKGDPHAIGDSIDAFGVTFTNIQEGIIGEVKDPLIKDEDWEDADKIVFPDWQKTLDIEYTSEQCKKITDKFVLAGPECRPFERLQFLRGTQEFYMDLAFKPEKMFEFIDKLHSFYCDVLRVWAQVDGVDGIVFMDDWGSQNNLLINPKQWVEIFKPMYKEYIEIIHQGGKKAFMHSDGHIEAIIPHLVEIGLDALNSQIQCMDINFLNKFKGKITFWGEVDRQHILPFASNQGVDDCIKEMYDNLWDNGGCFAQCEFGPLAKPENVYQVFASWDKYTSK